MTFVPYLFLKKNIIERVSEDFGVSPTSEYIYSSLPNELNYLCVVTYMAVGYALYESITLKQFNHFLVLTLTYLFVFSKIPHKETRFLLPIFPFLFLMTGNFLNLLLIHLKKRRNLIFGFYFLALSYEVFQSLMFYNFDSLRYKPVEDIMRFDPHPY